LEKVYKLLKESTPSFTFFEKNFAPRPQLIHKVIPPKTVRPPAQFLWASAGVETGDPLSG
jgi:hypothetical protein